MVGHLAVSPIILATMDHRSLSLPPMHADIDTSVADFVQPGSARKATEVTE
jgi:hypothetical protein